MKTKMLMTVMFLLPVCGPAGSDYGNCAGAAAAGPAGIAGREVKAGKCAGCPTHKKCSGKRCSGKMCPEKMSGVTTVARNISNGAEIILTAEGAEAVAGLRELALAHYGNKEGMDPACPGRVEGAEIKIENIANGARVLMTGGSPAIIKKIQDASAKEHGTKKYCPHAGAK